MFLNVFAISSGLLVWAWERSRDIVGYLGCTGHITHSLVFVFLFFILFNEFVNTSFSFYRTFVIEERHGFNKTTIHTFITDKIKALIIKCIFIGIFIAGLLYILEIGGEYFYFYVWIFVTIMIFVFIAIYPNVIAPCFNKFEPLEEGELRTEIEKLAEVQKFPLNKIYVIDGSKRSSHSNAYFFGLWNKHIVLFDTLISEDVKQDEIMAILCHELGHWKFSHMMKNLIFLEC
jgi:STE24 endopeptidase